MQITVRPLIVTRASQKSAARRSFAERGVSFSSKRRSNRQTSIEETGGFGFPPSSWHQIHCGGSWSAVGDNWPSAAAQTRQMAGRLDSMIERDKTLPIFFSRSAAKEQTKRSRPF
jgi:hypothetical protein